jgi:hypothetical protein
LPPHPRNPEFAARHPLWVRPRPLRPELVPAVRHQLCTSIGAKPWARLAPMTASLARAELERRGWPLVPIRRAPARDWINPVPCLERPPHTQGIPPLNPAAVIDVPKHDGSSSNRPDRWCRNYSFPMPLFYANGASTIYLGYESYFKNTGSAENFQRYGLFLLCEHALGMGNRSHSSGPSV